MLPKATIDICLCTYKRPSLLRETLLSLEKQLLADDIVTKIYVVDNDIAASAESVVMEFKERGLIDIHYDIEPEQNIALARNRSIKLGKGQYVAFIDDDEVACDRWLNTLYDCFQKFEADAVFGPVLPIYPANAPNWVKEAGLIDRPHYVTGTQLITGGTGNALVKRSLLESRPYPFNPLFGLTGGEDAELFRRASKAGAKLIWCEEAVVQEHVPHNRITLSFVIRRAYRGGQSYARIVIAESNTQEKMIWFFKRLFFIVLSGVLLPFSYLIGRKYGINMLRKLFLNLGQFSIITGHYFYEYRS